jgi:hypothetical protein
MPMLVRTCVGVGSVGFLRSHQKGHGSLSGRKNMFTSLERDERAEGINGSETERITEKRTSRSWRS